MQKEAIAIYSICIQYDISLKPQWIPREVLADYYSKIKDSDNWSIDLETFSYINYGEFTVDRFTHNCNTKHLNFNSKFSCPNTSPVFSCEWSNEFNWFYPPVSLIGKTVKHARDCKCKGVLFVPLWKSAYFWPLLTPDGYFFFGFVKHFLVLDPYFSSPTLSTSLFKGFAKFKSLALYIDFSENNETL